MVNLSPDLQVGNFASREVAGATLLRLQKHYLTKPVWLDLVPAEVVQLHQFLGIYLQGVSAPVNDDSITEVQLFDRA